MKFGMGWHIVKDIKKSYPCCRNFTWVEAGLIRFVLLVFWWSYVLVVSLTANCPKKTHGFQKIKDCQLPKKNTSLAKNSASPCYGQQGAFCLGNVKLNWRPQISRTGDWKKEFLKNRSKNEKGIEEDVEFLDLGGPNSAFKVGAGTCTLTEGFLCTAQWKDESVWQEDPHDAAPNLGDAEGINASWLNGQSCDAQNFSWGAVGTSTQLRLNHWAGENQGMKNPQFLHPCGLSLMLMLKHWIRNLNIEKPEKYNYGQDSTFASSCNTAIWRTVQMY